VLNLRMCWY